jgi:hypothetical protein
LICEGISAQRVSFNLKTITVIFSLNWSLLSKDFLKFLEFHTKNINLVMNFLKYLKCLSFSTICVISLFWILQEMTKRVILLKRGSLLELILLTRLQKLQIKVFKQLKMPSLIQRINFCTVLKWHFLYSDSSKMEIAI